jgi:hypothetical protein
VVIRAGGVGDGGAARQRPGRTAAVLGIAILTTSRTSIGGPDLVDGVVETCVAAAVEF